MPFSGGRIQLIELQDLGSNRSHFAPYATIIPVMLATIPISDSRLGRNSETQEGENDDQLSKEGWPATK